MIIFSSINDKSTGSMTLKLCGHAGAAERGRDIVCASASILAYTLAEAVCRAYEKGKLKRKPTIRLNEGDILVTARPKGSEYDELKTIYKTIEGGYELLMRDYPQNITSDKA